MTTPVRSRSSCAGEPFQLEQVVLALDAAGVAAESAAAAQHAMAGDDDRQRVGAERVARGALGAGTAGLFVMFALILARSDQGAQVFDQLRRSTGL